MGVRGGFAGVVGCGVGFLVLLLVAAVLVGCRDLDGGGGVTPPPPPPSPDPGVGLDPSDPRPLFVPAGVSASEYGASLPFDISAYDSNAPGVFTVDEMSLVDVLSDLHADGVDVSVLQGMVDRFQTVGPVIPHAVRRSYEEFVKERVFDSELVFDASTIGIVDLHQMLPAWSLPGRHADPDIAEVLSESPTSFPINYAAESISGPDWSDPSAGAFLGYLKKFAGVDECNGGGRGFASSTLKMNMHREAAAPDSVIPPEVLWHEVSLPTLPGSFVRVRSIFVERRSHYIDHHRANITFREYVHPYDRSLVDTPWFDHLLSHVAAVKEPVWIPSGGDPADVFAFAVGDVVTPDAVSLYLTPWFPAFLLDYILMVPGDYGVGYGNEHFAVEDPISPLRAGLSGRRIIDLLAGRFYPEGVRVLSVQPRYNQNFLIQAACGFAGGPSIR